MTADEPQGDVANPGSLDPESLRFMCGLEIHQQLDTGKLHSRQPGDLYDFTMDTIPDDWERVHRRLRASEGESGKIDVAARFEARRNRSFVYVRSPNAGLIELDEAPPLSHDESAVDIALTVSSMMGMHPVPVLQAMRKTVVDGSNTSGFQRTTLVATGGQIETESDPVGISVLCLEEDSARKLDTEAGINGEVVTYTLDRLGVPLIEIATEPEVNSPNHAQQTARALGQTLRDTRNVRRGLGTIRQDLNVSIGCGDRVEIKGCQDLDWIPRIISLEMARQLHFYRLANDLRSSLDLAPLPPDRSLDDADMEAEVTAVVSSAIPFQTSDVTSDFTGCESKMVRGAIDSGSVVFALRLPGLAGKLGTKTLDTDGAQMPRLGRELASAAKLAGVRGIFHSDELPAYGITDAETEAVRSAVEAGSSDAFVLCVAPGWQAELALESVVERARMAFHRIPKEVRNVVVKKGAPEDGTTTAMRPLPGSARMYPETDVPVVEVSESRWKTIVSNPPPSQEERRTALVNTEISENQVDALLGRELDDEFHAGIDGMLAEWLEPLPHKAWATLLLDKVAEEVAESALAPSAEVIPLSLLGACLNARESGSITREGLVPLAARLLTSGDWHSLVSDSSDISKMIANRAEELSIIPADSDSIEPIVAEILDERADFVTERGMGAMGPLMGVVLQRIGSGADGKQVSEVLKRMIQERM